MEINPHTSPLLYGPMTNDSSPITLSNKTNPTENSVKYLGIHRDKRLTWVILIKIKRKSLKFKLHQYRKLYRSKITIIELLFTNN